MIWPFNLLSEITKKARLTRYTVLPVLCEVCRKALKNGDLLFTFDHIQDGRKVGEHTVWAHADCLVYIKDEGPVRGRLSHRESPVLSKEEWLAWKEAVGADRTV